MERTEKPALEVSNLKVHFKTDEGILKAVDGVDFHIGSGKTLGLVGESGCGKSVTAHALLKIIPEHGELSGTIRLNREGGESIDIVGLSSKDKQLRSIRGKEISMIFQEPMTSLSPVHTIGAQIIEAVRLHRTKDKKEAREIAGAMLKKVGITNPSQRLDEYPQQLSGGMRQRAMIAMALSCNPSLLIADEPTTALDVTIQAQVLELMQSLQEEFRMGILFITHDLGVIAEMADEVAVMYLGKIIEYGSAVAIFENPSHPYTRALIRSIPKLGKTTGERLPSIKGSVPIPIDLPPICGFLDRCEESVEACQKDTPPFREVEPGHFARCVLQN